MMRSMYSGVSGLKTHQTKMDVIGNNIANVNTVAYKSNSITFSELMYQTTQKASGAGEKLGGTNARQIGLGVRSGAIGTAISSQGATQTTGNPFDLCITGKSFFIVSDGSTNYFTRAGAFNVDAVGNLVMASNGYLVQGWGLQTQTDEAGNVTPVEGKLNTEELTSLKIMSDENMTTKPEATTKGTVSGIIDRNDPEIAKEAGRLINFSFYDKSGYSWIAKFTVHDSDNVGKFYVQLDDIVDANGKSITSIYNVNSLSDLVSIDDGSTYSAEVSDTYAPLETISFSGGTFTDSADTTFSSSIGTADTEGNYQFESLTDDQRTALTHIYGTGLNVSNISKGYITSSGNLVVTELSGSGVNLTYDTGDGAFKGINGTKSSININFVTEPKDKDGETIEEFNNFSDIEIDWSVTNMYNNNGTSSLAARSGDSDGLEAGRKLGNMTGVTIQQNGMIYAAYDNGVTRLLGQIGVAEFPNPEGLEKSGDNLYVASLNSGEFTG
ncbi:MAG: flagellar hook-basal body complex protein, partial [Lachnospiraceae bacterium]|nr:flagellar hook-basal body complex protein [Lachnospiraceae bacterium]